MRLYQSGYFGSKGAICDIEGYVEDYEEMEGYVLGEFIMEKGLHWEEYQGYTNPEGIVAELLQVGALFNYVDFEDEDIDEQIWYIEQVDAWCSYGNWQTRKKQMHYDRISHLKHKARSLLCHFNMNGYTVEAIKGPKQFEYETIMAFAEYDIAIEQQMDWLKIIKEQFQHIEDGRDKELQLEMRQGAYGQGFRKF